ncbi:hypothetical protein N7532_000425 [Penicillium argentinense]|uniref:Uncharacterized protein n=1 Tax=Penicillium argentinense TaxID=1131581 RepID=A0A9W9KN97_9EURO|nr:uncharacterized protein N7532_000425 [Penicillium argentinense]KAJ5112380.1 hypothetical protein N7532_000425 [Penicillium argentinense]
MQPSRCEKIPGGSTEVIEGCEGVLEKCRPAQPTETTGISPGFVGSYRTILPEPEQCDEPDLEMSAAKKRGTQTFSGGGAGPARSTFEYASVEQAKERDWKRR